MATVLAVMANPRKNSYTERLLQTFWQAYKKNHPEDTLTIVDVYKEDIPVIDGPIVEAWHKKANERTEEERRLLAKVDVFTEQFLVADKIILAAPMWNLQFPPLLMAYLATVVVAGRTFSYAEHGWQGLVPDKPVVLLHVRGGVFSGGPASSYDHAVPYLRSLCSLLGITNFQTVICEGIEAQPAQALAIFQQAEREAQALAEVF